MVQKYVSLYFHLQNQLLNNNTKPSTQEYKTVKINSETNLKKSTRNAFFHQQTSHLTGNPALRFAHLDNDPQHLVLLEVSPSTWNQCVEKTPSLTAGQQSRISLTDTYTCVGSRLLVSVKYQLWSWPFVTQSSLVPVRYVHTEVN